MRVAVVEDDKLTQKYITDLLTSEGFLVDSFYSAEKALEKMKSNFYKVVVCDVNLPVMSGYDLLYFVRKDKDTYGMPKFLMLTERIDQEDVNTGLKMGANDYVKKPFDDTELLLRINALAGVDDEEIKLDRVKYRELFINFGQSYVVENNEKIELSNKERELLHYLVINQGIIVSKEKLYMEVWEKEYRWGNKNLEAFISRMKKKVKTIARNLENIKNVGYRLRSF